MKAKRNRGYWLRRNAKVKELLGISGTSAKTIMYLAFIYHLHPKPVKCYRCGEIMFKMSEMSVDHKEAWLNHENPKLAYFDTNNLALSHRSCNSLHGTEISKNKKR